LEPPKLCLWLRHLSLKIRPISPELTPYNQKYSFFWFFSFSTKNLPKMACDVLLSVGVGLCFYPIEPVQSEHIQRKNDYYSHTV
jgi:hypothetical protein